MWKTILIILLFVLFLNLSGLNKTYQTNGRVIPLGTFLWAMFSNEKYLLGATLIHAIVFTMGGAVALILLMPQYALIDLYCSKVFWVLSFTEFRWEAVASSNTKVLVFPIPFVPPSIFDKDPLTTKMSLLSF